MTHFSTVDEMNKEHNCSKVQLQLLRCLSTSDMTFMYMLLDPGTLDDILTTAMDLVHEPSNHALLTVEERDEFAELAIDISNYIDSQRKEGK